jgi:hydroxymethylpyrimidine pyrophosphatase-like HAD family hydrolase
MKTRFSHLNIIRTTSPIDGRHVWIEVFPAGVSKGRAASWLCNTLNIAREKTMSIGNDYNDLAMLEWTRYAYAVANSPADLRCRFSPAPANDSDGFTAAVKHWLNVSQS